MLTVVFALLCLSLVLVQQKPVSGEGELDALQYAERSIENYGSTVKRLRGIAFDKSVEVPDATRIKAVEALGHLRARDVAEEMVNHLQWDICTSASQPPDVGGVFDPPPPRPHLPVSEAIIRVGSPTVPHLLRVIVQSEFYSFKGVLATEVLAGVLGNAASIAILKSAVEETDNLAEADRLRGAAFMLGAKDTASWPDGSSADGTEADEGP
jgi:hypothetical protein